MTPRNICLILPCLFLFLLPGKSYGQNPPECDSLTVIHTGWDTLGRVTLEVTNSAFNIFGYPGFAFFDTNNDTLAKEQVFYFGIGNGPQMHWMDVQTPFTLPQSGFLHLYGGFYDTLYCVWPFTINDTLTAVEPTLEKEIQVGPNPAKDVLQIHLGNTDYHNAFRATILNVHGQVVRSVEWFGSKTQVQVHDLPAGNFFLQLQNQEGRPPAVKKFVIRR
jgi:hypothetical protein